MDPRVPLAAPVRQHKEKKLELLGDWTVIRGSSRGHDCFRKYVVSWTSEGPVNQRFQPFPESSGKDYIWQQEMQSERKTDYDGGFDVYSAADSSWDNVYILDQTESFALVYVSGYGYASGNYESLRIYAKDPQVALSSEVEEEFKQTLASSGIKSASPIANFCQNEL